METINQLQELAGCSLDEAESIAGMLDDAILDGSLFDYYIVNSGTELVEPEEDFVEKFIEFLTERLGYRPEVYWKDSVVEVIF